MGTIVHTDIRPDQNFLKTPMHDQFLLIRLGDFGLADLLPQIVVMKIDRAADVTGTNDGRLPEWFVFSALSLYPTTNRDRHVPRASVTLD